MHVTILLLEILRLKRGTWEGNKTVRLAAHLSFPLVHVSYWPDLSNCFSSYLFKIKTKTKKDLYVVFGKRFPVEIILFIYIPLCPSKIWG